MMHRSRVRCNLYTRVYLSTQTQYADAYCDICISIHMEALHLGTKNYWLSFYSRVTNGICPSIGFPSTQVCVLLCPTASYINSTQFETYHRCLLLCVFVDSSRVKPVFIAIRTPRNPLPRHGAQRAARERERVVDEKSPGSGFQRARSGEIWPRHVFTTIHLLAPPMCDMTYIASSTLLLETNLPSEDLRLYRQY